MALSRSERVRRRERAETRVTKLQDGGVTDDVVVKALLDMFSSRDNRVKLAAIQEYGKWKREAGEFSDEQDRMFGDMSMDVLVADVMAFLKILGCSLNVKKNN